MTRDTILFDFDGTLLCTDDVVVSSFLHTLAHFGVCDVPRSRIESTFGALIYDAVDGLIAEYALDCTGEEFLTEYRAYHDECFARCSYLFDGIIELLQNLKEKGYKIAVVTTRRKRSTHYALELYDIKKYFDYVLTSEDCPYVKPDARVIDTALAALHSTRERAVIIGDSHYDIECGANASVPSIYAAWCRPLPQDIIDNMHADYVAYTPWEVVEILEP